MSDNNISTQELDNLYELARKARAEGNSEQAMEYYQKIAEVDKDKWEPLFYSNYTAYYPPTCFFYEKTYKKLLDELNYMWWLLDSTVKAIAAQKDIDKTAAIIEIFNYFSDNYDKWKDGLQETSYSDIERNQKGCLALRYARMSYAFGDVIVSSGLNCNMSPSFNISAECWKIGNTLVEYSCRAMKYPDMKYSNKSVSEYTSKIIQYEPGYRMPVLPKAKKSGCYIATCVYGSYDCPQVWTLRRYRDERLAKKLWGRAFIRAYYAVSPTLVRWFGSFNWFSGLFRPMLDRMVDSLMSQGFENTPYQDR